MPRPINCVIEGESFGSFAMAFGLAKAKGYKGSYTAFYARLRRGYCTWDELLRTASESYSRARKAVVAKKREEMRVIIEQLDARKRGTS